MCILIADNVHPLVVQHDWGECHNFREASARPEDHPIGGAAAGEGKKNIQAKTWVTHCTISLNEHTRTMMIGIMLSPPWEHNYEGHYIFTLCTENYKW